MKIKYNIVGKKNINAETKQVTILLQKDEDEQNNKIYQLNIFPTILLSNAYRIY